MDFGAKSGLCAISASDMELSTRNINVNGRRTSLRLEEGYWESLDRACLRERLTASQFCTRIVEAAGSARVSGRDRGNLTALVRMYLARYYAEAATEIGHAQAGHGAALTPRHEPRSAGVTSPTPDHRTRFCRAAIGPLQSGTPSAGGIAAELHA